MSHEKKHEVEEKYLQELLRYKERFKVALKAAKICVFEVDLVNQLYTFFENAEDIFGVSGESILKDVTPFGKLNPTEYMQAASEYFSHPDDSAVIAKAFNSILNGQATTYQARMKAGNTSYIWCKVDVTPIIENNIPVRMIGIITDISELKEEAELLKKKSKLDSFTGLYTKVHSEELIKEVLRKKSGKKHALILFDLDHFKNINDTHGHIAGDEVLKSVSDKLKSTFRKTDILGRFGGDEFIILLNDIPNQEVLNHKLKKLLENDNQYMVTKSIGVSVFPDDANKFDELIQKADFALYWSKRYANTYTMYSQLKSCSI